MTAHNLRDDHDRDVRTLETEAMGLVARNLALQSEAHAAIVRKAVKLACPKCWSAEHLTVQAVCNCQIDERGRAWPAGSFDGSYNGDSDCRCECGWEGDVAQAEDAFSECCTACQADPRNIVLNDGGDGRYCSECHCEDV